MPTTANCHCCVATPIAKDSMPSDAPHLRPCETLGVSPVSLATVTRVTAFSAMLRANTNQATATSAIFHASCGNSQHPDNSTKSTSPEAIIVHSQALALRMLSNPCGQVSVIHSAGPSELSDLGPSTHRKYVPKKIAAPHSVFHASPAWASTARKLNSCTPAMVSGIRMVCTIALRSRTNHRNSLR